MDENKIYWVRGNTQQLLIPLEQEIVPEEGEIRVEPYYPSEDADVTVTFKGKYISYKFTPIVDGNLLIVTDNGTLSTGAYGIEITVVNKDGTRHRSLWDNQVVVTLQNDSVLKEWDEFKKLDVKARAAVFFFAKGDKGDAFTYDDFTTEQIEELQKPASDAAEELTQEVHTLEQQFAEQENQRISNESQRKESEASRIQAENARHRQFNADHQQAVSDHTQYESDHATAQSDNAQYTQDHEKELERESAETLRKQSETQRQTNEQQRQYNETQREETFATYEPKIDAKLDMITQEQFNQIFE